MLGRLLEEAAGGTEAGVGEDRVDATELVQPACRQRLDLIPLGDVAGDRDRRLRTAELEARSSSASRLRAASTRRYRSTATRAVAAPMPLLAPVINKTGFLEAETIF